VPGAKVFSKGKQTKKATETTYEVLNPESSSRQLGDEDEEEEEAELPTLTPSLQGFAQIALHAYEASWSYIQAHPDVVVPGAADALLVAGFRAQVAGRAEEAKKCVHQSKLLNYCESLGPDGVRVFFLKCVSSPLAWVGGDADVGVG
jgi:cell division cycle protein 37